MMEHKPTSWYVVKPEVKNTGDLLRFLEI